ncbi:sugar phosphate isomerase/epimerase family protein [Marinivivus vitaminiproducens]|uniref:sugar phosphate isomerase/epimerase family protein n=1 Tax=Marinivivus vitaminiproducens TaxID=3035935 RepID=UPI002798CFD5|nr:TIM barrel protein [Geminicoccaceae bacterium SCSIO 64248]
MTDFTPGLCSVTFRRLEPAAIVAIARAAGLRAIEWAGDVHVRPGDLATARSVRAVTENAGLTVASYGSYVAPPEDGPDGFGAVIDTAAALGTSNIRIWPGTRGRASTTYAEADRRRATAGIAALADMAEQRGVTVALEHHPDSLTDTTESAERLVGNVASSALYLYWQPRPGLPLDEALAEIGRLGRHVSHLHVFAWDRSKTRYPLASQADYWRRIIAALPATRWPGRRYAMLEFVAGDAPERLAEDAATLADVLASVRAGGLGR